MFNDLHRPERREDRAAIQKAIHGNGRGASLPLAMVAANWPTPTAQDADSSGGRTQSRANDGTSLTDAIERSDRSSGPAARARGWATPTARDARSPNSEESQARRRRGREQKGEQLPNQIAGLVTGTGTSRSFLPDPATPTHGGTSSPVGPTLHPGSRRLDVRVNARFVDWLMGLRPGYTEAPGVSRRARLTMLGNGCIPAQVDAAIAEDLADAVAALGWVDLPELGPLDEGRRR